jgi:NAD(P)H-nitrite reductase large subunit
MKEILKTIKNGAQNIIDIQMATKASTSCGRCKTTINNILEKEVEKARKKDSQLRIKFD